MKQTEIHWNQAEIISTKTNPPFTGVGYLEVEELFKGFRENWKFNCEECGKEVSKKELKEKTVECFKCKYNG